jgi:hypothetical protein
MKTNERFKKCINASFEPSFSEIMKLDSDSQAWIFETQIFEKGHRLFL